MVEPPIFSVLGLRVNDWVALSALLGPSAADASGAGLASSAIFPQNLRRYMRRRRGGLRVEYGSRWRCGSEVAEPLRCFSEAAAAESLLTIERGAGSNGRNA